MRKISDFIIMSDVDGTLLPDGKPVPERNIEALRRFTAKGGRFGIATGRSVESAEEFARQLPVNAPCILYNGGAVYDYSTEKFLARCFLPDGAKEYLKAIIRDMPDIPAMVISNDTYYNITRELTFFGLPEAYRSMRNDAEIDELNEPWYKVCFSVTGEQSKAFYDYINAHDFSGVRFTNSGYLLTEMLPEKSTKGAALEALINILGVERECTAAIGDYNNDIEMLEFAPISAATSGAQEEVRVSAKMLVGACEDGAVADLVEYIESIVD